MLGVSEQLVHDSRRDAIASEADLLEAANKIGLVKRVSAEYGQNSPENDQNRAVTNPSEVAGTTAN